MMENERIRQVRESGAVALSRKEFAKRICIDVKTLESIEQGTIEARPWICRTICREFSVDYVWLMTGNGKMFHFHSNTEIRQMKQSVEKYFCCMA